jgi:hypothetical protein
MIVFVFIFTFSNSDDSDDELDLEFQSYSMGEVGSVEGVLCELTHEHELDVKVCCYLDSDVVCYVFNLIEL